MKYKITTTLSEIKKQPYCNTGWKKLITHLGKDYPIDKEINLLTILDSNGIIDCCWAFKTAIEKEAEGIATLISAELAESILCFYENKYPNDNSPRCAINQVKIIGELLLKNMWDDNDFNSIKLIKDNAHNSATKCDNIYFLARCAAFSAADAILYTEPNHSILGIWPVSINTVDAARFIDTHDKTNGREYKKQENIIKKYLLPG
jgi:hypothetical protein